MVLNEQPAATDVPVAHSAQMAVMLGRDMHLPPCTATSSLLSAFNKAPHRGLWDWQLQHAGVVRCLQLWHGSYVHAWTTPRCAWKSSASPGCRAVLHDAQMA